MMIRYIALIFLMGLLSVGFSQTVSITSDNEVCMKELLSFKSVAAGGTASAFSWDFGDGTSSTQSNPSHIYSSYGAVVVKLTVTFSGGGSASSSKNIMVHDLPKPDFSLDNSIFCFYSQNVCLKDNSTMGATTTGYSSRLILWGDGAQNTSSSPSIGQTVCYQSYPLVRSTPYNVIIEVVNDKGCEDKWKSDIYILKDYKPAFGLQTKGATCTDQEVCLKNDSTVKDPDIKSFEWDFGDGSVNNVDWEQICHKYTSSGTYTAKLKVVLKNGCVSEYERKFIVKIHEFKVEVNIPDSVMCFPGKFLLSTPLINSGHYVWELYDEDTIGLKTLGFGLSQQVLVPCPGEYFVRLKLTVGKCTKYSRYFHLSSLGVSADFIPLNGSQCRAQDTMYFVNTTKVHPSARPSYLWNFDDKKAPNCMGYANNCNKDNHRNSKHFYSDTGCYKPRLLVVDSASGCTSEIELEVSIVNTIYAKFTYKMKRPCIGLKSQYGVKFEKHSLECGALVSVCVDSLNDSKTFIATKGYFQYAGIKDSSGWVTVGFAIQTGSDKVFRSADTSDYYIEPNRICRDTIWYHNWFQMHKDPIMSIQFINDTVCLPIEKTLHYYGTEEGKLKLLKYSWTRNSPVKGSYLPDDTIPDIKHIYTEEGTIYTFAYLEDTFGCFSVVNFRDLMGFENSFKTDTVVCPGAEVLFHDSVRYYGDKKPYWRISGALEKMTWDFDDGAGFTTTGPIPKFTFTKKGVFNVRMATSDRNGCVDTAYKTIRVGGVNAAIKNSGDTYLCDQIIQFFDSSYFDIPSTTDKVKKFYWDFGDFTTESFLENPFHYYSSNGQFILTLAIETEAGCIDTARIPIYLKGPEPYFDIISDTVGCVPYTASFKSISSFVSAYQWSMGDQNNTTFFSSKDTSFSFTYSEPGTYYIFLEGSDSFYNEASNNKYTCSASFPDTSIGKIVRRIIVLPIPKVDFSFNEPACVGQPVLFSDASDSIYTQYNWTIGGKDTTTTSDLLYVFDNSGTFSIKYTPTYVPEGPYQRACFDSFENNILVSLVLANFSFEEKGLCNEFQFIDSSTNAVNYNWFFDYPDDDKKFTSAEQNPTHKYGKDSGEHKICLIVNNEEMCADTSCVDVTTSYIKELKLYNVFTPNSDGVNDEFIIDISNHSQYSLKIFNRWGEQVFSSQDSYIGWNGRVQNVGKKLPESTYFYVLKYAYNCEKKEHIAEGLVSLIRNEE